MKLWALKIYSKWAKAHRDHMDEWNLTKMSLLTDREGLCGELLCILERKNNKI